MWFIKFIFVVTDTGSKVNDCTRHLCVCKCACMCMFVFVCVCVCVCVLVSVYLHFPITSCCPYFLRFQSNFGVSVSTCMLGLSLIFRFTRVHVFFMQYFKTKTVITSLYCGFSK